MALVEKCDVFFARQSWQAIRHQLEVELGSARNQPSNSHPAEIGDENPNHKVTMTLLFRCCVWGQIVPIP